MNDGQLPARNPNDPTTRREFLAASAVGMLGMRAVADGLMTSRGRHEGELLYVGTYTDDGRVEGVYLTQLNTGTGELRYLGQVDAGKNPTFLAIHPNGRTLYAVNEVSDYGGKSSGAVTALAIAGDSGTLTKLTEQPSMGAAPCYVSVDRSGRALLVANYMGGNVAMFPILDNGSLGAAARVVGHRGTGPNKERQEAPHAHCIIPDPSNRFALAADLGADRVFVHDLDADRTSMRIVEDAGGAAKPGAGPRHLTFHPRLPLVYVANELDSTVSTLRFDRERGTLSYVDSRSTLPDGWTGTNYPADIHLSRAARTLYVSNRGHNSIAVFTVATGTGALTLDQVISTDGDWPRNFSLDPSERWLLAANQRSGTIVVFARDTDSGRLRRTGNRLSLPSPVCLRFRAHAGRTE
jgi:6-phosphogluconolactonase